jgi:hypothetical protein
MDNFDQDTGEVIDASIVEAKPKRGRKKNAAAKNAVAKIAPASAVSAQDEGAAMFGAIERIMTDPSASVERAHQAFEFYQKVEAARARKAFDAALADAKAEIPPIIKNRTVSHETKSGGTKSYKHEDLGDIARTVDPILSKHGLSYRFRTTSNANEPICVTCIVSHRLGYSEGNSLSAGRDDTGNKNSLQAIGSTITYLQRYTLKAALGLAASTDDDGAAVSVAPETISDKQADTILELLALTNTQPPPFLAWAKVANVSDIKAKDFEKVVGMLKTKHAKMEKVS